MVKKVKSKVKTEQELLGMTDRQYKMANSCANYTLISFVIIAVLVICGLALTLLTMSVR